MKNIVFAACALLLAGCAVHQSQLASQAQKDIQGMTKKQVIKCMGPAHATTKEGGLEVWSYFNNAGTQVSGGNNAHLIGNSVFVNNSAYAQNYNCLVNLVFENGKVDNVQYLGNTTKSPLAPDALCANIVKNCVQTDPSGVN